MRFLWITLIFAALSWAQTGALTGVVQDPTDTVALSDTLNTDSLDLLTLEREGPDTVEYSAVDLQYDFPSQTFNLNNKALIKYRGISLTGDTIWFDQGNQVLQASGRPVLNDPRNPPLSGYRMKYNMNNKIGQVFYGSSYRDNQRFNGMDIRRLPDTRLQLARGDFSTCNDSTHQHFYFYSRRMVVTPKENVVAAPVVLNIADVPVAVLPLLVSPLKTGKRSGLLAPKFGGDQQQGFYLTNIGVYWAISDYMDATLSGDIIEGSAARFEKSSLRAAYNYKKMYVLDGNVTGQAYLNEFDLGNSGWDVHFKHKQNLRPDEKSVLRGPLSRAIPSARTIPL
jgi:lipopolysaccharide assembly outer membrane protein LptD (OstA)